MHNLSPEEKKDIYSSFLRANYWWVFLSILIGIFSHISRAIRWKLLLEPMGYNPGIKNTFFAVMIGYFANMALPRLGEVTRCGILARYEKIPMQKSFGTVVTERGLDLISLTIVFLLNFVIHLDKLSLFKHSKLYLNMKDKLSGVENPGIYYWMFLGIVIILLFLLFKFRHKISHFTFYKKIREIILGFVEGLKSLIKIKKPFWFIFHSINIWIMYWLMTWVVFFSIPETSHLGGSVGLAVLVFGSIGIIIVQGGIGIYPWIVAEILVLFQVIGTKGYALGWLLWTGQSLMIVIFGLLSMILLPMLNLRKNGIQPAQ
ncbi:MAG: flippase-like domain-containing protein [Bacteroidales bacterium]|nr:flippase-like domain-containing protein [Bacteroidales bacterium]MCF8403606.1 flippase-like domain-containing protein [Bacteroidales bacterium]